MRLLPILMEGEPDKLGWQALGEARAASGHEGKVKPARAVPGSPQPILAVGKLPDWLTDYAYVSELKIGDKALEDALGYALDDHDREEVGERYAELLTEWMGVTVKYVEDEAHDTGVQFS